MNKNIFIYLLFVLVILSAAVSAVSASENITEPALLSVGESYIAQDDTLSSSIESVDNNEEVLSLSNEEIIEDDNVTLALSNEKSVEDDNEALSLSDEDNAEVLQYGERVYTNERGGDYVSLSNGYTGFCTEKDKTIPLKGTEYYTAPQNTITHVNRPGERVDNKLRLAVIYYAEKPEFKEKINIPYALGSFTRTQQLIWYLCQYDELKPYAFQYLERDSLLKNAYYDIIDKHNHAAEGYWINEDTHTINNGTHEITYEFLAFKSRSTYQSLFGYKKTIKEIPQTPEIPKHPGMIVDKKSLTPNVKAGEQTKFLITVWNTGELDLGNVFVKENMPADLEYADYTNKNLWRKEGDIFYYNNVLKVGESADFTIIFNTNKTGSFTNVVVAGSNETDNKTTENKTTVKKPGMDVNKKSLTPNVKAGEQTKFLITVWNTGELDLGNVFVKENMPADLEYADYTNKNLWRKEGDIFYYNNVLKVGESADFTIIFNTNKTGSFTNVVVAGSNETDNKTTENKTTVKKPGMDVNKKSLTPNVKAGEQTKFLITVWNTGELDLGNVFVKENMPADLEYADYTNKNLWRKEGDIFYYNNVLRVGESADFTIIFNTNKTGSFTNVVVAGSNETENKTTENKTTVKKPDMKVEKITLDSLVVVGEQVTFEIVVSNTGQTDLSNVFVEESQYDGLTFDHAVPNRHWSESVVNGKHRWTLNSNLLVGERIALNVVFNTTRTGTFTNVVVAGSDDTENKTTENKTKVIEPKLDVEKITLTPMVHVGDNTSFEIVVRNSGDVILTNVYVEETSYEGLTYDSFVRNSEWTYSTVNGKHRWTLNKELHPHEVSQFIVIFKTTEVGTFTNVVTAGSDNTTEKPARNTTIVYNETPEDPMSNSTRNPDLSIEKIAIQKLLTVGQKAQFEIVVHNTGNVALSKVTVYEESYTGLTYDSWNDNSGMWSKNSDLSWTYNGVFYPGEYASFFVTFNTANPGDFTNVVSVDSNETPKKRANDNVVVIEPSLSVEKITLNNTVNLGEQVTFEIIVHNTGSTVLTNVVVREDQFDGLTYNSYVDYTGNWKYNGDLTWTLNTPLKPGEYSGFFVVFDTTRAGDFTNIVIAKSNEVPETPARNTTKVITPENPVPETPENPVPETPSEPSVPVTPENPVPVTPENPVPETPSEPSVPVTPENPVSETPSEPDKPATPKTKAQSSKLPATGNPLVMVLLALIALGVAGLRRKD